MDIIFLPSAPGLYVTPIPRSAAKLQLILRGPSLPLISSRLVISIKVICASRIQSYCWGRRELCRRLPENADFNVIPLGGEDIECRILRRNRPHWQSLPWCRIPSKARWASQFPCVGQNQSVLPIPLRAVSRGRGFSPPFPVHPVTAQQPSNSREPSRESSETNVWLNTSFALTILLSRLSLCIV